MTLKSSEVKNFSWRISTTLKSFLVSSSSCHDGSSTFHQTNVENAVRCELQWEKKTCQTWEATGEKILYATPAGLRHLQKNLHKKKAAWAKPTRKTRKPMPRSMTWTRRRWKPWKPWHSCTVDLKMRVRTWKKLDESYDSLWGDTKSHGEVQGCSATRGDRAGAALWQTQMLRQRLPGDARGPCQKGKPCPTVCRNCTRASLWPSGALWQRLPGVVWGQVESKKRPDGWRKVPKSTSLTVESVIDAFRRSTLPPRHIWTMGLGASASSYVIRRQQRIRSLAGRTTGTATK